MFGAYIRQVRIERGMEQEDLGLAIGESGNYISRLETGRLKKFPEPPTIRALARELGLTVEEILLGAGYLLKSDATFQRMTVSGQQHELRRRLELIRADLERVINEVKITMDEQRVFVKEAPENG